MFGAVDGLVTNGSLIAGVGGSGLERTALILTGRTELTDVLPDCGVDPDAAAQVAQVINNDPDVALRFHMREELGVDPSALPSPLVATAASLLSCAPGGLVPLLPFLLGSASLLLAVAIVAVSLFLGGEDVGRVTGRRLFVSGLRQLALGVLVVGVAYGIRRRAGSFV